MAPADVPDAEVPSVTILAAARNEGAALAAAAASWLAQRVPRLSLVIVDDRSTDETPALLAGLATSDARLRAVRIDQRPASWLGKCHALQRGLELADGDYLLLTDGDVRLHEDAVRRAAAWCRRENVDHLALLPRVHCDSLVQEGLTAFFFQCFLALLGSGRRVNTDDPRQAVGIGAFALVRREALLAVGGFEEIRLQVGDDVALARMIVRAGGRHRVLSGTRSAELQWQRGVLGTISGLEKNAFWGARLSWLLVLALTGVAGLSLAPLAGLVVGGGTGQAACAVWALATALPYMTLAPRVGTSPWLAVLHPLSTLLLVATVWNSALRTTWRGGIAWRGDLITVAELKSALKPLSWWRGPLNERPLR